MTEEKDVVRRSGSEGELDLLRQAFVMFVDKSSIRHAPPELRAVIRRAYQAVEPEVDVRQREENTRRYREAIDSVNRATDREIDAAMAELAREGKTGVRRRR
jgi:hypothetical protein